jgi:hypothetical protein
MGETPLARAWQYRAKSCRSWLYLLVSTTTTRTEKVTHLWLQLYINETGLPCLTALAKYWPESLHCMFRNNRGNGSSISYLPPQFLDPRKSRVRNKHSSNKIRTISMPVYLYICRYIRFSYMQIHRQVRVLKRIATSSVPSVTILVPSPSHQRNKTMLLQLSFATLAKINCTGSWPQVPTDQLYNVQALQK